MEMIDEKELIEDEVYNILYDITNYNKDYFNINNDLKVRIIKEFEQICPGKEKLGELVHHLLSKQQVEALMSLNANELGVLSNDIRFDLFFYLCFYSNDLMINNKLVELVGEEKCNSYYDAYNEYEASFRQEYMENIASRGVAH